MSIDWSSRVRVRIVSFNGTSWFATSPRLFKGQTDEEVVRWLNAQAIDRSIDATYHTATEEEYQAYRLAMARIVPLSPHRSLHS